MLRYADVSPSVWS